MLDTTHPNAEASVAQRKKGPKPKSDWPQFVYRHDKEHGERRKQLAEITGQSEAKLVRGAVDAAYGYYVDLFNRAGAFVAVLLENYGRDAVLAVEVQEPPNVELSIDGRPVEELRAVAWQPDATAGFEGQPLTVANPLMPTTPIRLWAYGHYDLKWQLGEHKAGDRFEIAVAALPEHFDVPERPPTPQDREMNRLLREQYQAVKAARGASVEDK
jgi:hypothetical protein